MKKYIVNKTVIVIHDVHPYPNRYKYPGDILTQEQYESMNSMYQEYCSVYKKAPKAPKLYNLELHKWDKEEKISRHISTHMWNSPYRLCKWQKKCMEDLAQIMLRRFGYTVDDKDYNPHPNFGYYYTIIRADKKK